MQATDDLLMYSISDTDNFSVNDDGEVSTIAELDYESLPEDAKYHMVTVSAVDPSGASDSIMVKITVTDADDKPVITGDKTFEYPEGTVSVGTFSATDADGDDIVWGKSGKDAGQFKVTASEDGASAELTFDPAPDFESAADNRKDNVYKVNVTASGMVEESVAVEITITDVDEDGKPTLTKPQPQIGRSFKAEGPDDPDVPNTDVTWQWSRSANADGPWENIGDPSASGSRSPKVDDENMFLRATAMYTDKLRFRQDGVGGVREPRGTQNVSERAAELRQPWTLTRHYWNSRVMRTVDELVKGAQVGKPITASDDDDVLVYSLTDGSTSAVGGAEDNEVDEATLFAINGRTAQITTKAKLDSNTERPTTLGDTDDNEVTYTVIGDCCRPVGRRKLACSVRSWSIT